jgi:chitodextrinase
MIAQIARFETGATGWSIAVHAANDAWGGGVNDIPTPSLTISQQDTLVVALGGATSNMSPYTAPAGFTEPSGADCGYSSPAHISMTWGYQVQTAATNIAASAFDGFGSTTGNSRSVVVSLAAPTGSSGGGGGTLTRTDFGVTSDLDGVGTGPFSTAPFTPASNSLQLVSVYASAETDETFQGSHLTLSNSAGLTCTPWLTSPDPLPNTWGYGYRVWTCPVGAGTSMTFAADAGAYDIHHYIIERFEFTGHDTSSPVGATVATTDSCSGPQVSCPATISLSAAPASSSQVLAFASVNGGCYSCDPAPASGWTEIHDLVNVAESWGEYQSQVRTGSTSISVSWADLNSGNTNPDGAVLAAIEIRAGTGGGDTTPPTITITAPPDNVVTNNASTVITGSVSEPATLTINGQSVPTPSNSFSYTTALNQGANTFTLIATDAATNPGQRSLTINLDTAAPATPNVALITVGPPVSGQVSMTGAAGAAEANATVRVTNLATGAITAVAAAANGSFAAAISASTGNTLMIQVIDAAGNVSQAVTFGIGIGVTKYTYDVHGRLKTVTTPATPTGADQIVTTHVLDDAGNRESVAVVFQDITPPNVPTGLTAIPLAFDRIRLNWTPSLDVGGGPVSYYKVYRGGSHVASPNAPPPPFDDWPLVASTAYSYRVSAVDPSGNESALSNQVSATTPPGPDVTPPSVPANLQGTAVSGTQVNLSWGASTDIGGSGLAGYELFRNNALLVSPSGTSHADTGASVATTYAYKVRAYDGAGNRSAFSNEISVTTPDTLAPSAPGNPTFSAITVNSATADWTAASDNVGVTGYRYSLNGGSSWTDVGNVLSASLTGLAVGTQHTMLVQARDAVGNWGPTSSGTFTTASYYLESMAFVGGSGFFVTGYYQGTMGSLSPNTTNDGKTIVGFYSYIGYDEWGNVDPQVTGVYLTVSGFSGNAAGWLDGVQLNGDPGGNAVYATVWCESSTTCSWFWPDWVDLAQSATLFISHR